MPFNNYFNLNRFARLLKQDLLINKTKYLLTIIGLGLITYLLLFWKLNSSKDLILFDEFQIYGIYRELFYYYMLLVGVVVGTAFPDLSDKIKTRNYLLNPGSCFEKFLLQFLIRIMLFVPVALGIFWIAIRLAKASLSPEMVFFNSEKFFDPFLVPYFEFHDIISFYHENRENNDYRFWGLMIFSFYFSYGTYLLAGATYFKRFALVKTVILSAVVLLTSISFSVVLSHIFYPLETKGFDIKLKEFAVTDHLNSIQLFMTTLALSSWLFFLAIAYFKLKEKEA